MSPMRVTETAAPGGGKTYVRVIAAGNPAIHQRKLTVAAALIAHTDADGFLPPGLPIIAGGLPVSADAQTALGVIGPEGVWIGKDAAAPDQFGNTIEEGFLNKAAIQDNLARNLTAFELTALANGGFKLSA